MTTAWRVLVFLCFSGTLVAAAQQTNTARIRFIFENPKLQPASYVLDINEDGSGHFHSESGSADSSDPEGITPQPVNMDIRIEEPLRSALFKTARSHNFFAVSLRQREVQGCLHRQKGAPIHGP